MTENNYPPGCTQTDHDEAHKDDAPSCPECGSAPCSCERAADCSYCAATIPDVEDPGCNVTVFCSPSCEAEYARAQGDEPSGLYDTREEYDAAHGEAAERRNADHIDGYDRDDLGLSEDR